MTNARLAGIEEKLVKNAAGVFTEAELEGIPDPVRRYLGKAIASGTPIARTARIRMKGTIKIGMWVPFRAREVLTPHLGFIWFARAAGLIGGSDHYAQGGGEMDWKLAGLLKVVHADGPDVSRSAAERGAAEAIWVPTVLLPRFGVEWTAEDDTHVSARFRIEDRQVHVHYQLTADGYVRSVLLDRWGDPDGTGTASLHPFGGEFTKSASFDGVTIPTVGRLGWHYGSDRWSEGEFFRFRITNLALVGEAAS